MDKLVRHLCDFTTLAESVLHPSCALVNGLFYFIAPGATRANLSEALMEGKVSRTGTPVIAFGKRSF